MLRKVTKALVKRKFRGVEIPSDLSSITSIDYENEVSPAESGLAEEEVATIWDAVEKFYRAGMHPLISICLQRGGKVVFNRSIGYHSGEFNSPDAVVADYNTPVCLFSASKAISAMLVHLLAEQNKVHLLDPVCHYIPAFAAGGKANITIYQLLAHRAGVPGLGGDVDPQILFNREEALARVCAAETQDKRGRDPAYHAITSGFVIDELIRVTTGLTIQQYLDRYIRKPMGMKYFRYGLTTRDFKKAAVHRATGLPVTGKLGGVISDALGLEYEKVVDLSNSLDYGKAVLPSANLYCTAEESSRFFQMLLDNGRYKGKQILSPLTVYRAVQESGKVQLDGSLKIPLRYSPGFMMGGGPLGMYGRDCEFAFGHLGLSNIVCWADPERDIAVSILNSGKPVLGPNIPSFVGLQSTISKQCPKIRDLSASNEPVL
jgi:CubicO group peptidase (beta-lactamase class C family)